MEVSRLNRIFGLLGLALLISSCQEKPAYYAYTINYMDNTINGYRLDESNGDLLPLSRHKWQTGKSPFDLEITPSRKFLYVANMDDNTISMFKVNAGTGKLGKLDPARVVTESGPISLAIHPSGNYLYVANSIANSISAYKINSFSGNLTFLASVPSGARPAQIKLDASGKYLYSSNSKDNTISMFGISQDNGELHSLNPAVIKTESEPLALAFNSTNDYLYVSNVKSNSVIGYHFESASGNLSYVPGRRVITKANPVTINLNPRNRQFYVNSFDSLHGHQISVFYESDDRLIASPTISLTDKKMIVDVTFAPFGDYVYLNDYQGDCLDIYKIDPASGNIINNSQPKIVQAGNAPVKTLLVHLEP